MANTAAIAKQNRQRYLKKELIRRGLYEARSGRPEQKSFFDFLATFRTLG